VLDTARTMRVIKKRIQEELNHPYLREQLELPVIEEEKLFLLLCMLKNQKLTKEQIELYATTIALIQIALDTHDRVKNGIQYKTNQRMQLTVLAGDYFSSLYYQTLARVEKIDFIKMMAEAIQLVNENKMLIYNREVKTFDEFMECMKFIVTTVYRKTAEYFADYYWQQLVTEWLHFRHLQEYRHWYRDYLLENQIPVSGDKKMERVPAVEKTLKIYLAKLDGIIAKELSENPYFKKLRELFRGYRMHNTFFQ